MKQLNYINIIKKSFLFLLVFCSLVFSQTAKIDRIGLVYEEPSENEVKAVLSPQNVSIIDSTTNFYKVSFINKETNEADNGWISKSLTENMSMDKTLSTANKIIKSEHAGSESLEEEISFKDAFISSLYITEIPAGLLLAYILIWGSIFPDKRYKKKYKVDADRGGKPFRRKIWTLIILGLLAAIPLSLIFYFFNIKF